MLEKKFTNKDLGIELKSFIDKQQNVWFIGKDVTEILGFKDSVNALKRHVSLENKMIQLIQPKSRGGETPPQQSKSVGGPETGRQQKNTKVKCCRPETPPQQNEIRGCETRPQPKSRGGVSPPQQNVTRGKYYTFINEPGFYELVFGSKLEFAKKFRQWVFNTVLPSIRKYTIQYNTKCLIVLGIR